MSENFKKMWFNSRKMDNYKMDFDNNCHWINLERKTEQKKYAYNWARLESAVNRDPPLFSEPIKVPPHQKDELSKRAEKVLGKYEK